MDVRIERLPAVRIAFIRSTGPYCDAGAAFGRLYAWAGPYGLVGPGTRSVGLCYDDPKEVAADKLRYDACITVGPEVRGEGEVGAKEIPGGEFVIAMHRGSYEKLGQTYEDFLRRWFPASGRKMAEGPIMERYLNDPRSTPEADLRTEICVRLA